MKKICFWAEYFGMGGLQKVNVYLGEYLSKNYDVSYFSSYSNDSFFENKNKVITASKQKEMIMEIQRYRRFLERILNNGDYTPVKYNKKLIQEFIDYAKSENIETLIVNARMLTSFIPTIKKLLPHLKIIAWQHSNHERYFEKLPDVEKLHYLPSFIKGLEAADVVVCLTDEDLPYFSKYNKNTVSISNPLTLKVSGTSNLLSKNIAIIGRIQVYTKGLDYLVQVAKKLPDDWSIYYAGGGSPKEEQAFNDLIIQNNVETKFKLQGRQDDLGLKRILEDSSIYVMTSRWEGFPLVLAEAMSFGLPIVAFNQIGSRAVLDNGKYGFLVEMGNVNQMADTLVKLCNDLELRKEYQKKSLTRVSDFDAKIIIEEWEQIL